MASVILIRDYNSLKIYLVALPLTAICLKGEDDEVIKKSA